MTKNNTLIIDGQLFQNDTIYRGMGRYSIKFLEELLLDKSKIYKKYDQIILLLNKNIATSSEKLSKIKKISSSLKIDWIKYPKIIFPITKKDVEVYKDLTKKYILTEYPSDDVTFFILSNFEVFHSLSVFPDLANCKKMLLFYDLIPHLFFKEYLNGNAPYIQEYYSRFINILTADRIFTISATTKNDIINFLNIDPDNITNINGSLINDEGNNKLNKINTRNDPFFLSPSGDDTRKNNDKTIEAFSKFSLTNNNKYTLIITSNFSDQIKKKFIEIKDSINPHAKIEFSGNVSDSKLKYYYKNCLAVIFIPTYEGLGLPILEAVNYGKKIIASDIPVFKEISTRGMYFCNPKVINSVVESFQKAVLDKIVNFKEYDRIKEKYTWKNTVNLFIKGIDGILNKKTNKKLKIALVGPSLTGYSAIAKYCEDIYPKLQEHADVDYFYDLGQTDGVFRGSYIPFVTNYNDIRNLNLEQYKKYDYFLYNLGNSEYHVNIYKKANVFPGILIVHDCTLSGLFNFAKQNGLFEEKRFDDEKTLQESTQSNYLTSILNSSLAIIVHSFYAKKIIFSRLVHKIEISKIDHPSSPNIFKIKKTKPLVISMAGIISSVKGTNSFIDVIKNIYRKYENKVSFKIFGYDVNNELNYLKELLKKYPCELVSNLSDLEFQEKLNETNILINFREQYNGETSRSCIDAFKHGVVSIVRDIGWFSEIPDDCVLKIKKIADVESSISKLIDNPEELRIRSINSQKLIDLNFNVTKYVDEIFGTIKNINKNNPNYFVKNYLMETKHISSKKILSFFVDKNKK